MVDKNKEPFAIVTSNDEVVTKDIYSKYIIKEGTSPSNQIKEDRFVEQYKRMNLVKPLYNPESLAGLLEINTFHRRCVNTKAQDIASLGWHLEPLVDNPNEPQKELVENLFEEQFPPFITELKKSETDYQSIGYSFLELVREGHRVDTIYKYINHAPAHTIRVHKSGNKYAQLRGAKSVWFKNPSFEKDVDKETGNEYELGSLSEDRRANEMIMMLDYTPRSDYYGLTQVITALGAIMGNLAQREYNNSFFKNHGIPNYAVYITGDYNLDKDEEGNYIVVESIKSFLSKVQNNPHSSLVFGIPSTGVGGEDVKVHFEKLAVSEKDASFRMYRKDNRDEVIIAHGVPAYRIGLSETGSLGGSTAKESNEIYKESVITPREEEIEAYINKYILRDNLEITDWEFRLNTLELDSTEQDRQNLEFLFNRGSASPNDLIRNLGHKYGIETVDNPTMDEHYINGSPLYLTTEEKPQLQNPFLFNSKQQSLEGVEDLFRAMKDSLQRGE